MWLFITNKCAAVDFYMFFLCVSGFKSKDSIPNLVLDYMAGRIKLDEFVTHTMNLEQVNDAIELMKKGEW